MLRLEPLESRTVPTVIPDITVPEIVTRGLVDADPFPDTIAVAGPGGSCRVVIVSGDDGSTLLDTIALPKDFRGGGDVVYVHAGQAAGRPTTPGYVVVGAGPGGGPVAVVFSLVGTHVVQVASFYAGPEDDRGGLRVGAGDVNRDGRTDGLFLSAGSLVSVDLATFTPIASVPVPAGVVDFDPAGGALSVGRRVGVTLDYPDTDPDPFRVPAVAIDPLTGEDLSGLFGVSVG